MTAFLGVERSLSGRRWVGLDLAHEGLAQSIAQESGLPEILCRTLARRGVAADQAAEFIAPTLKSLMPDPSRLKAMDTAVSRISNAVTSGEAIAIFADYDVDGGCSAALLIQWFRAFGQNVTLYVPDRIDEGFGPNEAAMAMLAKDHQLIICVDCGTLSHGPIPAAKGADVIVLDHHQGGETLPGATAVVNPNRQDESGDFGYLCAAGVVFLTLVALNRLMRRQDKQTPDLLPCLDLVALATVADVAPLIGLNRALVRQGLKIMARRQRPGLRALGDVARLDSAPNAFHLGFLLGPRVNAGGRIGKSDLGARLLSTQDEHEAAALAARLDALNTERREVEAGVRLQALEQAGSRDMTGPLVWAANDGWHPGVVGIVAARLKETANRPAVVIGFDGDEGKGSGRSINGVDLGAAIARLTREGLLQKGGGHKMAAGLSLSRDQLEPAMQRLSALLAKQGADKAGPADLQLDGVIAPRAATIELIQQLEMAGPFGAGASAPRFALPAQRIAFAKRVGESHLRLTVQDESGGRLDAIAFQAFDGDPKTALGPALLNHAGALFHVAGRLEIDTWGGRQKPKLRLEDAAAVDP